MVDTVKRIVLHKRLMMMQDGKVQHIPQGTELTLTKTQAASPFLAKKLADPAEHAKLNVSGEKASAKADNTALAEATKEMAELKAQLKAQAKTAEAAKAALKAVTAELTAAKAKK